MLKSKRILCLVLLLGIVELGWTQIPLPAWAVRSQGFMDNNFNLFDRLVSDAKMDRNGFAIIANGDETGWSTDSRVTLADSNLHVIFSARDLNTYELMKKCALSTRRQAWIGGSGGSVWVYDYAGNCLNKFRCPFPVRDLVADSIGHTYLVIGDSSGVGIVQWVDAWTQGWSAWYAVPTGNRNPITRWGNDDKLYLGIGNHLLKIDPLNGQVLVDRNMGAPFDYCTGRGGEIYAVRYTGLSAFVTKINPQGGAVWTKRINYVPIYPSTTSMTMRNALISADPYTGEVLVGGQFRGLNPQGSSVVGLYWAEMHSLRPDGSYAGSQCLPDWNFTGHGQQPDGDLIVFSNHESVTWSNHVSTAKIRFNSHRSMQPFCASTTSPGVSGAPVAAVWTSTTGATAASPFSPTFSTNVDTLTMSVYPQLAWRCQCFKPRINWQYQRTGQQVQFMDSLLDYQSFYYDFGDGVIGMQLDPVHVYAAPGWYNVTLYSTNLCGTDSLSQWIHLCANVQMNGPTSGCVGQQVNFQNTSTPGGLPATWLVDGTVIGTGQQLTWMPTTAGTFSIGLIVQNQTCTDTVYRDYIAASPSPILPADTAICTNVNFTLQAGGGPWPIYQWSTGQGGSSIVISQPGTYWVQATDNQGCAGRDSITIGALPTPDATISLVPNGLTIHFSPFVPSPGTYWWSFGDGATDTSMQATHTYSSPFFYNVCLRIDAPSGCVDSSCILLQVLPTGQESPTEQAQLSVQTSPDHPRIHVRANLPGPEAARFRLHDLAGRTLWEQALPPAMDFDFEIPAEGWAAGCYLLSLEAGEGRVVRRVMLR